MQEARLNFSKKNTVLSKQQLKREFRSSKRCL